MKRPAFTAILVMAMTAIASTAFAQAKPAAPTSQPAPATRAKWVAPVKGIATVQVIPGASKPVGDDIVTVLKVKNVSSGAIALLRVDEYWYDKSLKTVSGDTQRHRQPLYPGEVVEITMRSPRKPNLYKNTFNFSHANGKIEVKTVKKFTP